MNETNNLRVTWIDPLEQIDPTLEQAIEGLDMTLSCVQSIDELSSSQILADIFVIRLSDNATSIDDLRTIASSFNSEPTVIARVPRQSFDLAVNAMDKGIATVIAVEELRAAVWTTRLEAIRPGSSLEAEKQGNPAGQVEASVINKDDKAFVFVDPLSRNLLALTERVAQSDVSVLLTGPTGAGKEVVARLLHESSARHSGPFVAINCAAMPENLVEDMLFGHEKGSFTGASKAQSGLFEQANGGTVFLDEIGDMSFNLQAKLLRVLQERNVVRLGGQRTIDLDIRVIAATNCDLKKSIATRDFREDLYFRLSAFKLAIPPLRERPLDIMPLVNQFIQNNNKDRLSKEVTLSAQRKLLGHHWPGNVRELENVISRALVLAHQTDIDEDHLIFDEFDDAVPAVEVSSNSVLFTQSSGEHGQGTYSGGDYHLIKDQITSRPKEAARVHDLSNAVRNSECQAIIAAINSTKNRKEAAERLGISPRTLRHKIQKLREEGINLTHAYAI